MTRVHALVDRMCVGLEEDNTTAHPTVRVVAEEYGSLKLGLYRETEPLVASAGGTGSSSAGTLTSRSRSRAGC